MTPVLTPKQRQLPFTNGFDNESQFSSPLNDMGLPSTSPSQDQSYVAVVLTRQTPPEASIIDCPVVTTLAENDEITPKGVNGTTPVDVPLSSVS